MEKVKKYYWGRTLCSFLLVLAIMPIGHAAMILMEHFLDTTTLHYSAFVMGFIGLCITIFGVFIKNDTRATIVGLLGALLFWTGWVEFLFSYYAWRFGVHCDLVGNGIIQTTTEYVNGIGVSHDFLIDGQDIASYDSQVLKQLRGSRPEYLILPATFGMWMMFMLLYTFCTRTGCLFFNWIQSKLRVDKRIKIKPLTRIPAITTFMEFNLIMWSCYLLLMFCYDPVFLGSNHWLTIAVGLGSLVLSLYMFHRQLRIRAWGANIRMAIATVIIFWNFVEIIARNGVIQEIWVAPLNHTLMLTILVFSILAYPIGYLLTSKRRG